MANAFHESGPSPRAHRLCATGMLLLGCACLLPAGLALAETPLRVGEWWRWLPATSVASNPHQPGDLESSVVDSASLRTHRPEAAERLVLRWTGGPASLPWNGVALELVVKYQQNPLRAARMLAHLHAAANDAVVGLTVLNTDDNACAVAVHAELSTVLAYFYPRESPGRLEAMGVGAMLAVRADVGGQAGSGT